MIDFQNVQLTYQVPGRNSVQVFNNLSVTIQRGEMVYLVGPSGSGKSSLFKLLYMDVSPDVGHVQIGDFRSDAVKPSEIPYLRRQLGIVFQDFQLLPDRSVADNVAFALRVTGKSRHEIRNRITDVLSRVGLSHKRKAMPHELSGGEQQRICIARAIANEPHVLLADEPTGNLDPNVADDIQALLMDLHRQGMTLIIATHDYRIVKQNPARTLAFVRGQLLEVDPLSLG